MKQSNFIRRLAFGLCLMIFASLTAQAQEGLNVEKIFQRYGHAKGCKMVEMHNTSLKGYQMKVYKSLIYKSFAFSAINGYLKADRKAAKKIREVVDNGKMTSGYYMMAPLEKGINRYILFSNPSSNKGTVIYIEGELSPDDIMKLCYSRK